MNKKFLSAILFGALMVSSTGTFVSCKDYDDDIDELHGHAWTALKVTDRRLWKAKINAGKWITSCNSCRRRFHCRHVNDGSRLSPSPTVRTVTSMVPTGTEWTISEDGFWVCNGEKTDR